MNWFRRAISATLGVEPAPPSAALVGKLPTEPDFVRLGGRSACIEVFDAWLVHAAAPLCAAASVGSLRNLAFCFCLPKHSRALVGVLEPSQDSRGREFPVAVLLECNLEHWRTRLGELWQSAEPFRSAAQALILELGESSTSDIREQLSELPGLPTPEVSSYEDARLTSGENAGAFLRRTIGSSAAHNLFYAVSTLEAAFAEPKPAAGLAIDCPVRDANDTATWLQLASQLSLQSKLVPSALFSAEPARLVISAETPLPQLLRALVEPGPAREQLWPLTASDPTALEHARATLSPIVPELMSEQRDLTLDALAQRLTRTARA
jgi:type VI secretion system protein ImpM